MSDDINKGRLREPPAERFAGAEHLIDFPSILKQLHREHPPSHGHRQMVVFKRGNVTMSLFSFAAESGLPEHKVNGVVTIFGLGGSLMVTTPSGQHDLTGEGVLVLDPGVPHRVHAHEESQMLVTVCLEK